MNIAIVLGGGDGTRAGGDMPKQFQLLCGEPVLLRSIRAMAAGGAERIYAVIHPEFLREWEEILEAEPYRATVVCGGRNRWHSVSNALMAVADDGYSEADLIAVHDGARPLVPEAVVKAGWLQAAEHQATIPAIAVTDSLRRIYADGDEEKSVAVDRSLYRAVQTPQVFRAEILVQAYRAPFSDMFTDDASVVESAGHPIHLFPGSERNIKITNPGDFAIAAALLNTKQ